jgi:hypothetical protein
MKVVNDPFFTEAIRAVLFIEFSCGFQTYAVAMSFCIVVV